MIQPTQPPCLVYARGLDRDQETSRVILDSLAIGQLLSCCNPKILLLSDHLQVEAFISALASCLSHYPVLSGRVRAPEPHIARRRLDDQCSYISMCNSGAELNVEEIHPLSIDQISLHRSCFSHHNIDLSDLPSYCSPLRDPLSGKEPIMKIKITLLTDSFNQSTATILSFNWLHAVMDGYSASSFISSLASFYSREVEGSVIPFMPATVSFDRSELMSKERQPLQLSLQAIATSGIQAVKLPSHLRGSEGKESRSEGLASLELQQIPLPCWFKAMKSILSLVRMAKVEEARHPRFRSDLSSITLHLPSSTVESLKLLVTRNVGSSSVSTNDTVSSLVWCLFASLRNRPLPGSDHKSSKAIQGALGLAIDMRRNCKLNPKLFGSAVWAIHIRSDPETINPSPRPLSPYARALICGAASIRRALRELRAHPNPASLITNLSEAMCTAPRSSQWHLASNIMQAQDAMVSSWMFDYYKAKFGQHETIHVMGWVLPTPPWSSSILPSCNCKGGLDLILTVPSSSLLALRSSPILHQLTPEARFSP